MRALSTWKYILSDTLATIKFKDLISNVKSMTPRKAGFENDASIDFGPE